MCGVVGIVAKDNVNQVIFDALTLLQHRGQDAAGIATCFGDKISLKKANGLVRDVFRTRDICGLSGNFGIGHVRYPTQGTMCETESQPFYVNSPYGLALAHNGNLTNAEKLKEQLFKEDLRHLNTNSDSEIILNVLAHELQNLRKLNVQPSDFFTALKGVYQRCRGGYSVVTLITGVGVLGFRDPFGIRPLVYGVRNTAKGDEYMLASESVALTALGFSIVGDVQPGEAVFISQGGKLYKQQCVPVKSKSPCLFEFVYFARPDSVMDNISVYKVRKNIGHRLAQKIKSKWSEHDIDVVVPVPETARSSAISLAKELGVKFREGFVKNRYIGRTFIMPGQIVRKKSVNQKLSALDLEIKDKNILIIDDSIVRGTTCKEIIEMARIAGAKKVYFASASPPVRFANIYGIDMPSSQELIAHNRDINEIQSIIGADKLIYLDLDDLISVAAEGNKSITQFDTSVFDGHYVTGNEENYLAKTQVERSDNAITASLAS